MCPTLGAALPVAVLAEMFKDTRLAECVQTLIDRVGISIKSCAERTLEKNMEITFSDVFD